MKQRNRPFFLAGLWLKHGNFFKLDISLSGCFVKIVYYKPFFSCEGNPEVHLIFQNFSLDAIETEIVNEKEEKFLSGLRRHLNQHTNFLIPDQMRALLFEDNIFDLKRKKLTAGKCDYLLMGQCFLYTNVSFSKLW